MSETSEELDFHKFYPVIDRPPQIPLTERDWIHHIQAKPSGEFRRPKRGEYYLSGAKIEAYRMNYDSCPTEYFIAKLWIVERVTIIRGKDFWDPNAPFAYRTNTDA